MGAGSLKLASRVAALALWVALSATAPPVEAQSADAVSPEDFVGAWQLADWRVTDAAGNVRFPYGENAEGQISYSSNGRMSAHLMRPPASVGEPPEQYLSYWGGFSVDADAATVTHHVIGSTQANFIGTDLVRQYSFEGENRLILRAGTNRLTWERVR